MNREIDEQGKIIGELNDEIDTTTKKLNFVQKKLGKLLKTNGKIISDIRCRYGTNLYHLNFVCNTDCYDLFGDLYLRENQFMMMHQHVFILKLFDLTILIYLCLFYDN